jgi:hypothetical protein
MAAHRYWRLYITAKSGASTFSAIAECELHTSVGGSDVTGSGTASANSVSGGAAANAFDNNAATIWATGTGAVPHWLAYDFGAGNEQDIVEVSITSRSSSAGSAPGAFQLQYSDDGSTWTTRLFCNVDGPWPVSTTHVFNTDGVGRYWRIYVTAVGSGDDTAIAELEMFTVSGGADQCTGGTASALFTEGANAASQAFDDSAGTAWLSGLAWAVPQWLEYDFGSGVTKDIVEVSITAPSSNGAALTPMDFQIQWAKESDDVAWMTKFSVSGATGWANGEKRYYDASGLVIHAPPASVRPVVFVCT